MVEDGFSLESKVEWYYVQNGQQRGPISADEMRALARSGRVRGEDLVWKPGMGGWLPASSQPEWFGGMAASPPPPPIQTSTPASNTDAPAINFPDLGRGVQLFFVRAFGWNLQTIQVQADEARRLEDHGITDATMQRYAVWRLSILCVLVLPALVGAILHTVSMFSSSWIHEELPRSVFGWIVAVIRAIALYVIPGAGVAAAFCWYDFAKSHRIVLWSSIVACAVPIVTALLPISWLISGIEADDEASLKQVYVGMGLVAGLYYVYLLFPTVISLIPAIMRPCLRLKSLLPGSVVPGWVLIGFIPLYFLIWLIGLVAVNQFAGNLLLVFGFILLFGAPLVYLIHARLFVRPLASQESLDALRRCQQGFLANAAAGSFLLIIWLFTKTLPGGIHLMGFTAKDSIIRPWNTYILQFWFEYFGKSMFMTVLFGDLLLRMNHSIWHQTRQFAATPDGKQYDETMEQIGPVVQRVGEL